MPTLGKLKHILPVAKNDSKDLRHPSQALSFLDATGGAGPTVVVVTTVGGEANVTLHLSGGSMYYICATRVWSTGTTATQIAEYWED